jgi:hypothetical protein
MKKLITIAMTLIMVVGLTATAFAQVPAPGGPFSSAFRVQNLETSNATCMYTFYDSAGADAFTSSAVTVAPGDSLYVYVPDLTVPDGSYSAVVNCDRAVAAVSNFSDANSGASYSGISQPGMVWFAPGIYDNYFDYYSDIVVQNATTIPVDVTVEIFAPGSATPVATQTAQDVPVNAAVSFNQEGLAGLADDQFYSAKITGTGDIAPVVNIYGRGPYDNQLYSYNPFLAGSDVAYAPVVMNNYFGYNTAIVVQNMGAADATVTVEYTNGTTTNHTIAPGAAASLYTPSVAGLPAGNTLYGATVTSTNAQPIVVLVNESNGFNRAASYSGFAAGSPEVRAPIVEKRYFQYNSSVTCQNVGAAAATMTIAYATGASGTTTSPSIDVGGTHLFYQPTDPALAGAPPNYISSATITSAQPIVCVVNQDINEGAGATTVMDQLYAYNGIAP